jgi:hypothetical protein
MIIRSIWVRYPAARVGDADYVTTPVDRPIT